jgi:hypothetical protein
MAIAYLPIDIDVQLPDEKTLINYCEEFKITRFETEVDGVRYWDIAPVVARIPSEDWYDRNKLKDVIYNRYNPGLGPQIWANNIDKIMPEVPYMLNQLPFKELTGVSFMLQTEYVPHHLDPHEGDVYIDPSEITIDIEPHRYNIQMTQYGKPAFFVSSSANGEKIYPNITKEQPCFAFCERYHWHGSEYVGPNKIQLSVFGILDREKHKEMIRKNLEKYRDRAIIFPDPADPTDLAYHFDY